MLLVVTLLSLQLLESCNTRDTVIMKALDHGDIPLVLGLTPLMVASSSEHVDIMVILIQTGADE